MNYYISLVTNELSLLDNRAFVREHSVLLHEHTATKFQLTLRIEFIDDSVLYTNEYIGASRRKYAFQWQTADGVWLIRWDNVPHFPKLASFPDHQHDYRSGSEVVMESFDVVLVDVLIYINDQLPKVSK